MSEWSELDRQDVDAIRAEGPEFAGIMGLGPEVTTPAHRLVDLPPGEIWRVVNDIPEVSAPDEVATALNKIKDGFGPLSDRGRS